MNIPGEKGAKKKVFDLDIIAEEIQNQIIDDERSIFSDTVIELYNTPVNLGLMENADAHAKIQGWCGDTMEMFLNVKEGVIQDITFTTDGCGATVATGSMLTTIARGKSIEDADAITEEDLLNALGGLPRENLHCAKLSINTLRKAIRDFLETVGSEINDEKIPSTTGS